MVSFTFKIAYTEYTMSYEIPDSWSTRYTFLRIRDYIAADFDITNCYEFVYVNSIPISYNGIMEEYVAMSNTLLNNENRLIDTFREDYIHVFYIRFIEDDDYEELNGRIIAI